MADTSGPAAQRLNEQLSGALTSRVVPCFDDVGEEQLARSRTNVHRVVRRAGRHEEGITGVQGEGRLPVDHHLHRPGGDVRRPGVAVEQRLEDAGLQVGRRTGLGEPGIAGQDIYLADPGGRPLHACWLAEVSGGEARPAAGQTGPCADPAPIATWTWCPAARLHDCAAGR